MFMGYYMYYGKSKLSWNNEYFTWFTPSQNGQVKVFPGKSVPSGRNIMIINPRQL